MQNTTFQLSNFPTFLLSVFLFLILPNLSAQPQSNFYRAWVRTSATLQPDFLNRVVTVINSSSETYVAGSTLNISNTYSMLLSKYSSTGILQWSDTFAINMAGNMHVGDITLDPSGNILITGSAYNGSTNNYDLFTVKYNSSGTKLWHQLYNGAGNAYDFGAAVTCASNGDVFVTGGAWQTSTNMNAVTIRYNSSGTAQWTQTWDNVGLTDACGTIALNSSTGVLAVTGFSQTNLTTWEYAVLRYDQSTGNQLGATVTNQGGTTIELVNAAAFDASGNIYITGAMGASGQQLNIKTIKLDANLNILWTATYNGAANKDDAGRGIAVDASGNVYVAGYTTGDNRNAVLLKYTSGGSQSWVQVHDAGEGDDEYADLALTSGGEPFVGGYVTQKGNKDFFTAMYSATGSVRWSESHNGLSNKNDAIQQVTPDGEGNFVVAGSSGQSNGSQAVMTIKYASHMLVKPQDEAVNTPFIENRGQVLDTDDEPADDIRYYTRSMYPNVYISGDKVSYVFAHIDTVPATQDTMVRLDLSFVATSTQVQNGRTQVAVGLERQEAFHNYYLGHIPEGRERVPLENKVLQPSIYDNIDALYGQGQDGLFIRLICKPGSNPADIKLAFTGATALSVQGDGSLKVETVLEDLVLPKPTAMTVSEAGTETAITAWQPSYSISSGVVSITISSYDTTKTLVIKTGREREEPNGECDFYWSTYFGDASSETTMGNDVDEVGNMYYCGKTTSPFFPVTTGTAQDQFNGSVDAFVSCFKQPDQKKWGTFYGGTNGGGDFPLLDVAYAVKWKEDGIYDLLYFVGRTTAQDFVTIEEGLSGEYNNNQYFSSTPSGWVSRGYIGKLNAEFGTAKWVTLFGDSHRRIDAVCALHIGSSGGIAVGGFSYDSGNYTDSQFPFTSGSGQHSQATGAAYVAEFGSDNNLLWATKLANEPFVNSPNPTSVRDISEDGNGNLLVAGVVSRDDLGTPGDYIPFGGGPLTTVIGQEGFLMRFSTGRTLLWSRFFGGYGDDFPNSIVGLSNGDFYLTGSTNSTASDNFPVKAVGNASDDKINDLTYNGGFRDIFVAKFLADNTLYWCRYFGGPGWDSQASLRDNENELLQQGTGTGNCAVANASGTLYLTGFVENGFAPIVGNGSCPYFYNSINQGSGTNGEDAWLAVVSSSLVTQFSTYWGGSKVGENFDESNTIALGKNPFNGKDFVLFGGWTNSENIPNQSKPIPHCRESDGPYYFSNLLGGGADAFISKIYLNECLTVGTEEISSSLLQLSPNPTPNLLRIALPRPAADFQVFSITGQNLSDKTSLQSSDASETVLDVSQLPPGWYLLSAVLKDGSRISAGFIKI